MVCNVWYNAWEAIFVCYEAVNLSFTGKIRANVQLNSEKNRPVIGTINPINETSATQAGP